jgi:GMP synthase (glutamine-hydrolysing)
MKKILLVDYGSYYFKDIIKCMKLLKIEYVELQYNSSVKEIDSNDICGIILSGGPGRVNDPQDPHLDIKLLKFNLPVLGICYGMQLLMHFLGGRVEELPERDLGYSDMSIIKSSRINTGIKNPTPVWMAHYDHVTKLSQGFDILARTNISIAMIGNEERNIYAVQYHPEAKKSESDLKLLKNFIFDICNYKI